MTESLAPYLDAIQQEVDAVDPDAPLPELLQDRVVEFARLERLRRRCDEGLDRVMSRINRLRPDLEQDLSAAGITSTTVDGVNLHFRRKFVVNKLSEKEHGVTTQKICDALHALGRGDLVSDGYAPSSLKSYVEECIEQHGEVPEPLKSMLYVQEMHVLTSQLRS